MHHFDETPNWKTIPAPNCFLAAGGLPNIQVENETCSGFLFELPDGAANTCIQSEQMMFSFSVKRGKGH